MSDKLLKVALNLYKNCSEELNDVNVTWPELEDKKISQNFSGALMGIEMETKEIKKIFQNTNYLQDFPETEREKIKERLGQISNRLWQLRVNIKDALDALKY